MKRLLKTAAAACFVWMLLLNAGVALGQDGTLLPPTVLPSNDDSIGGRGPQAPIQNGVTQNCGNLATAIRTGAITLDSIPCFIKYFSQTLAGLAGSISLLMVLVGGYKYMLGSDEDRDAAKKTITYALMGLAVSLLAWVIVGAVLQAVSE